MSKIIRKTIELPAAPETLFETYVDARRHAEAVGAPASVSRRPGARFWVFDKKGVFGKNLLIVPGRLVVQTWRAQPWRRSDPDSILTLAFSKGEAGGRIELAQVLVPDHAFEIISGGWHARYWTPWRAYFERGSGT